MIIGMLYLKGSVRKYVDIWCPLNSVIVCQHRALPPDPLRLPYGSFAYFGLVTLSGLNWVANLLHSLARTNLVNTVL